MNQLADLLFSSLVSLNFKVFLVTLLNQYFPYGSFFWLVGLGLFIVVHTKTKNLAYASAVMSLFYFVMPYTGLITNIYSATIMKWVGALIGLIVGFYLYRSIKGG